MSGRRDTAWIWGPVGIAVSVRLALFVAGGLMNEAPSDLRFDASEYHGLGRALAEGQGFVYDRSDPDLAGRQPTYAVAPLRTPGYPALVAAVYAVAGPRPGAVILVQILLEGLTCALLSLALRPRLGPPVAGVAALAYALHPAAALYTVTLLSEPALVVVLVAAFAVLAVPPSSWTAGRMLSAGALWGVAVLVKPVAVWAPVAVAGYVAWQERAVLGQAAQRAVVLLAGCALVVAPWVARNAAVTGTPFLSTSSAYNALALYAAPVYARANGVSYDQAFDVLYQRAETRASAGRGTPSGDVGRAPSWQSVAVEVVRQQPALTLRLQAEGVVRAFVSVGRVSRLHVFEDTPARPREPGLAGAVRWWWGEPASDRVLDVWALAYLLVAYSALAVGLVVAVRRRLGHPLGLAAGLALYFVLITGIPGHSRFMVPAVPFWAPFVGLAVTARKTDRGLQPTA